MTRASDVKEWLECCEFSDTLNITIRVGDNFELFDCNEKLLGYMDTVSEVRAFLLGYERALYSRELAPSAINATATSGS